MEYLCSVLILKLLQFHAFVCLLGSASKNSAVDNPEGN